MSLQAEYSWNFVIETLTNLEILSHTPVNDAIDVPTISNIVVNFNSNIDETTIDNTTFAVTNSLGEIAGNYFVDNNTVTFTPASVFSYIDTNKNIDYINNRIKDQNDINLEKFKKGEIQILLNYMMR